MSSINNPVQARLPIATGQYTGNNTANRAIPHGLTVTPALVIIHTRTASIISWIFGAEGRIIGNFGIQHEVVTIADATNFYVGNVASYPNTANAVGETYDWVAFG